MRFTELFVNTLKNIPTPNGSYTLWYSMIKTKYIQQLNIRTMKEQFLRKLLFCYVKEWKKIAQNPGKIFEQSIKDSVPNTCWIYRFRDNAASFGNGNNTRFASSNICDYLLFDDDSRTLYLLELKSTQSTSLPLSMIRDNQIKSLQEASEHNLVAGFICNFRNENNDTFFIEICDFVKMMENINKKSFNINDLKNNNAIQINSRKKRTRYTYDIQKFVNESHL